MDQAAATKPARYAGRVSYSQVAEDLLIAHLLGKTENVRYLDIGCLWPVRFSNTYLFYRHDGLGVCVDPNPDAARSYAEERPRDIFVSCGVGSQAGELCYHRFERPVFNTFSPERAREMVASRRPGRKLIDRMQVPVRPLTQILQDVGYEQRFPEGFDFMSIDVEGFEMEVLSSMDFERVRPRLICCETQVVNRSMTDNPIIQFLESKGYALRAFTGHDVFMGLRREAR